MHNLCMTPAELLQTLLDKQQTTANALADKLGGGGLQSAMSRLLKGKTPRPSTIQPLADHFGIDTAAFLTDAAATDCAIALGLVKDFAEAPSVAGKPRQEKRKIPVVGTARMGENGFYDEFSTITGAGDGVIDVYSDDPEAYGIRLKGMSMFPAIRDGWYAVVEPGSTPMEGEYVLIKLRSGAKMVKELLYRRNGSLEVMSVNGGERMTIDMLDLDDIQAIGSIVPPSKWREW